MECARGRVKQSGMVPTAPSSSSSMSDGYMRRKFSTSSVYIPLKMVVDGGGEEGSCT